MLRSKQKHSRTEDGSVPESKFNNGHASPQLKNMQRRKPKRRANQKRRRFEGDTKYAIGIFDEGLFLHVVCLSRKGKNVNFVDAETYRLSNRLESVSAGDEFIMESTTFLGEGDPVIDATAEKIEDPDIQITETAGAPNSDEENVFLLKGILSKYTHRKYEVAISLSEPQVYYAFFNTSWGLEGQDLKLRVIEELAKSRPNAQGIRADDLQVLKLKEDRILAIVRDSSLNLLNLLENVQSGITKRISFVESAETSLINLVKENYNFQAQDLSLIVFMGHEYSRLIFMRGNEIYNISNIIEAFVDKTNVAKTIYSRILLEQDNLGLPNPNSIIITGETADTGIVQYLREKLPRGIHIDYLSFQRFGVTGMDPILSRFGVAIGAALRSLQKDNDYLYNVDLTPLEVKESQKIFKLGIIGWLLLALIPLAAFFATLRIVENQQSLNSLKVKVRTTAAELTQLEDVESRLNAEQAKLANYNKGLAILDSMITTRNSWSAFLTHMDAQVRSIGKIWITELKQRGGYVDVRGYTTERDNISDFADRFKNSILKSVEIQQINRRKSYSFHIETIIDQKQDQK